MTELSLLIPWIVVFVGLLLSLAVGHMMRGPKGFGGIIAAGILAAILGGLLTFTTVWAHSMCIHSFHLCQSRGDGNMSYWFHSFFAIPVFWIAMSMFGSDETPALSDVAPYDNAVIAALAQFRKNMPVTESCPNCGTLVSVERPTKSGRVASSVIQTSCKCGKCSGQFELGVTSA